MTLLGNVRPPDASELPDPAGAAGAAHLIISIPLRRRRAVRIWVGHSYAAEPLIQMDCPALHT